MMIFMMLQGTNWTDRVCRCDDEHWYDRNGSPPAGENGEPWDGIIRVKDRLPVRFTLKTTWILQ